MLTCCCSICRPQGILHRDLKLENTLLDDAPTPRVKICDFGYSKVRCPLLKATLTSYSSA